MLLDFTIDGEPVWINSNGRGDVGLYLKYYICTEDEGAGGQGFGTNGRWSGWLGIASFDSDLKAIEFAKRYADGGAINTSGPVDGKWVPVPLF
jgi:hypothetical protein